MNPIGYANYKTYFKDFLKTYERRGAVGNLALILDCDRTYVSQVLYGKADLLPDHIARFCEANSLARLESDYLMTLLLKNKASKVKARDYFEIRLEQILNESTELSKKFAPETKDLSEPTESEKTKYYSNINYMLVHILTSIREFQTITSLSKKLALSETEVLRILKILVEMKLVKKEVDRYVHSGRIVYIDSQSPQVASLHLNARLFSVQRSMEKTDIHFTNVFSISKDDMKNLKMKLAQTIDEFRDQIHASGTEQVGILCCDFFGL